MAVMKTPDSLYLIGPMGAGKTTIGRQLAKALQLEFIDSDHEIERRTGADIPWIFDIEGEEGFRRREREVIEELTRRQGIVLATGGGAVLDARNRADLAGGGKVVYLRTSVAQILDRTGKSHNRPLLQTEDPRRRVEELMAERDPLYREIADIIVETDKRSVRATVNEILQKLRGRQAKPRRGKAAARPRGPSRRSAARTRAPRAENRGK